MMETPSSSAPKPDVSKELLSNFLMDDISKFFDEVVAFDTDEDITEAVTARAIPFLGMEASVILHLMGAAGFGVAAWTVWWDGRSSWLLALLVAATAGVLVSLGHGLKKSLSLSSQKTRVELALEEKSWSDPVWKDVGVENPERFAPASPEDLRAFDQKLHAHPTRATKDMWKHLLEGSGVIRKTHLLALEKVLRADIELTAVSPIDAETIEMPEPKQENVDQVREELLDQRSRNLNAAKQDEIR